MNRKSISIFLILAVVFTFSPVWAKPDTPKRILVVPESVGDEDIVSLGSRFEPKEQQVVEGYAFIHYQDEKGRNKKQAENRKDQHGKAKQQGPRNRCYAFFADGAKWKNVEAWIVNPANTRGLNADFVFSNLTTDMAKWEDAADGIVGNGIGVNILGDGSMTSNVLLADTTSPDGKNEVYFADISSPGAIAVTIVWGIFSGPVSQRRIVEWDQVYDDVDFDWSSSGEAGKMDFENIAMHELGHSKGLSHPSDVCTEETMYRFSSFGETKKRDLNIGDINGINVLY